MHDKPEVRFNVNSNNEVRKLRDALNKDSRFGFNGKFKDKIYCIGKSEEKSPDTEARDKRVTRVSPFPKKIQKNNEIYEDDTEIDRKADQQLKEALDQS